MEIETQRLLSMYEAAERLNKRGKTEIKSFLDQWLGDYYDELEKPKIIEA